MMYFFYLRMVIQILNDRQPERPHLHKHIHIHYILILISGRFQTIFMMTHRATGPDIRIP